MSRFYTKDELNSLKKKLKSKKKKLFKEKAEFENADIQACPKCRCSGGFSLHNFEQTLVAIEGRESLVDAAIESCSVQYTTEYLRKLKNDLVRELHRFLYKEEEFCSVGLIIHNAVDYQNHVRMLCVEGEPLETTYVNLEKVEKYLES